jgi:hypothetical protein
MKSIECRKINIIPVSSKYPIYWHLGLAKRRKQLQVSRICKGFTLQDVCCSFPVKAGGLNSLKEINSKP